MHLEHEAKTVRDLGLRDSEDEVIFDRGREAGVTLLTKDKDFADIVTRRGSPPKVIWLRCGNTSDERMKGLLAQHLDEAVDKQVTVIAEQLLVNRAIPERAATDASHIAVATRHGMDFLLTWNCAHIANAQILRSVQRVIEGVGLEMPVICTPNELMGAENE